MKVTIHHKPNVLIEMLNLVFACYNGLSPALLTAELPYCVPEEEVRKMMDVVNAHLDRKDWRPEFYFQSFPINSDTSNGLPGTCVAMLLLLYKNGITGDNFPKLRELLHQYWESGPGNLEIISIAKSAISIRRSNTYLPISAELQKMDIPDGLRLRLIEVLSNCHIHVDQICDLLEPLAAKVVPMLEPWWERIVPRLDAWEQYLNTEAGLNSFLHRANVDTSNLKELHFSMQILMPGNRYAFYEVQCATLTCMVGVEMAIDKESEKTLTAPTRLHTSVLRLLSGTERIEMLRTMADRVMTPKELTQELGMNSGSIFRDLNNMYCAHMLKATFDGIHRSYQTDVDFLEEILTELLQYIKSGRKQP